jgi:hypothetical protein
MTGLRVRLPSRLSIGQPLTGCSTNRQARALGIVEAELHAMRIAEIEFGEVAVQMRLADMYSLPTAQ